MGSKWLVSVRDPRSLPRHGNRHRRHTLKGRLYIRVSRLMAFNPLSTGR